MKTLLSEARVFGLTLFGDGATIKTFPLVNVLAAGINNPFALLDIADCTDNLAKGVIVHLCLCWPIVWADRSSGRFLNSDDS